MILYCLYCGSNDCTIDNYFSFVIVMTIYNWMYSLQSLICPHYVHWLCKNENTNFFHSQNRLWPTVRCPCCCVVPLVVRPTQVMSSTCTLVCLRELPRWTTTSAVAHLLPCLWLRLRLEMCLLTFPPMSSPSLMDRLVLLLAWRSFSGALWWDFSPASLHYADKLNLMVKYIYIFFLLFSLKDLLGDRVVLQGYPACHQCGSVCVPCGLCCPDQGYEAGRWSPSDH